MTKRFSREQREASIKRVLEGTASAEAIAAEIGSHPATVAGWVRKAQAPAAEAPGAGLGASGARAALGAGAQVPVAPPTPAPTPDELLALVEGIREQTLMGIAQARDLDVTNPAIQLLVEMPDNERKILKTLAPQAAKYAGPAMDKAPQVCAVAFCLVYLASGFMAFKRISRLADRIDATKEPKDEGDGSGAK